MAPSLKRGMPRHHLGLLHSRRTASIPLTMAQATMMGGPLHPINLTRLAHPRTAEVA